MDEKTLRTTIDHLYQSVHSVAEKNPNILFEERDFERFPTAAKTLLVDNEVTKNITPGGPNTIQSIGLVGELGIRKIAVDQYFVEKARGR